MSCLCFVRVTSFCPIVYDDLLGDYPAFVQRNIGSATQQIAQLGHSIHFVVYYGRCSHTQQSSVTDENAKMYRWSKVWASGWVQRDRWGWSKARQGARLQRLTDQHQPACMFWRYFRRSLTQLPTAAVQPQTTNASSLSTHFNSHQKPELFRPGAG